MAFDIYHAASTGYAVLDVKRLRFWEATLGKDCSTRADYELACAAAAVEAMDDAKIAKSYACEFGQFGLDMDLPELIRLTLAQQRFQALKAQAKKPCEAPALAVDLTHRDCQLWEPCEHCGVEPSYGPLHLCDACWPAV